jgi:hypothetical protein
LKGTLDAQKNYNQDFLLIWLLFKNLKVFECVGRVLVAQEFFGIA